MAFGKGAEVLQAWKPLQPPKVDAENTFKTFGRQKNDGENSLKRSHPQKTYIGRDLCDCEFDLTQRSM